MIQTFKLRSIKYQNKRYGEGLIHIDEERSEVEVLYRRAWLIIGSWVSLAKFSYNTRTTVQVQDKVISIDGLAVESEDSGTIASLISKPRQKAIEKALLQAREAIQKFLSLRTQTLDLLLRLRSKPRETLLQESPKLPHTFEDPLKEIFEKNSQQLRQAFNELKNELTRTNSNLDSTIMEKLYALTYGIGIVQNTIFLGNETRLRTVLNFLSTLGSTLDATDTLTGKTIDEVTNNLLAQSFSTTS